MTASSLNIGLLMPGFYGGGAERAAILLAQGFTEKGHQVRFLVRTTDGPLREEALNTAPVSTFGKRLLSRPLRLRKVLNNRSYDAIISFVIHRDGLTVPTVSLSATQNLVYLTRIESSLSHRLSIKNGIKPWIQKQLMKINHLLPKKLIAVSKGVKQDLVENLSFNPNRIAVINNPLDLNHIDRARDRNPGDSEGLDPWFEASNRLITVGRLHPHKNQSLMISAFNQVLSDEPDSALLILGQGESREQLLRLGKKLGLEDRLIVPGFTKNSYYYISRAHLFVLSSKFEGHPLTLIESLACGTRIVSTDCPSGPAEILRQGDFGTLVPMSDVEALRRGILKELKHDSDNSASMHSAAEQYSYRTIADSYLELLDEQLSFRNGAS